MWIYEQLLMKAVKGNERCMFKAIDLRKQLLDEQLQSRVDSLEYHNRLSALYENDPDERRLAIHVGVMPSE